MPPPRSKDPPAPLVWAEDPPRDDAESSSHRALDAAGSTGELNLLYQITEDLLSPGEDLRGSLEAVLGRMAAYGMERGIVTIFDSARSEISIEASHGLTPEQVQRGRYRPGEGIIGKVIERGEPVLVPRIGDEPLFLDRTGSRRELDRSRIAFICVPVTDRRRILGTISVDRLYGPQVSLEEDLRLLRVIAMVIGEAVRSRLEHREEVESLRREKQRLEELHSAPTQLDDMAGNSHAIREVYKLIRQVAPFDTTVLLRGESGTGKELVARAIHRASARSSGPFVSVNCGALPEQLVAGELFGHFRGAHPSPESPHRSRFESADGGTIFLDEVGEISPTIQVKLLQALQDGEIERPGEERSKAVDVRVIAATHGDLEKAIENGRFREDLYYRLNVFPICVPPLRDRKSDVTILADHFLEKHARLTGRRVVRISTPAIELLTAYHWPGNVRELESCIARAVLLTDDGVIRAHHLPPTLQTGSSSGTTKPGSLSAMMMAFERELLIEAMKNAAGNQARAARALSTTPRILGYRLRKHGMEKVLDWRAVSGHGPG